LIAICWALSIYRIILFIRILSAWFPPPRFGSPFRPILEFMADITDPVLRPIRNMMPPVRAGAMAIDFSPIIVFVLLSVLQTAIGCGVFF
jgi:YggT family protein